MVGPRVSTGFIEAGSGRGPGEMRVFGQIGFGVEKSGVVPGGFAVRPGGGVDVKTPLGVLLRFELDYSFVPKTTRDVGGTRVLLAIGFGYGD